MKKRIIFLSIICCISLLYLTGCESSKNDRDKLFKVLKKQNIISESMKQIDTQTKYVDVAAFGCSSTTYYIYQDDNNNLIAITYKQSNSKDEYKHIVNVYKSITRKDITDTLSEEESKCGPNNKYRYENGEATLEPRYETESNETYHAYLKKSLFGSSYTLEKEEKATS